MSALVNKYLSHCNLRDSHQHHFEKRAVFAGGGVRAAGTNECVSTNGAGKHGFSDRESILKTTTNNLKHPRNGIICSI